MDSTEILLVVIAVGVILFFVIRKIVRVRRKNEEREASKAFWSEEKKRKQSELPSIIKEADNAVDKYEKRITEGQDKYQIGRALYEIRNKYKEEFEHRLYADTPSTDRQGVNIFYKRIADLCDSDILVETGYKDEEQAKIKQQQKAERSRQKQQAVVTAEKDEYITETFVGGSKASVEVLVNNYITLHKNYVLVFKAPIEESAFGTHSTTITMKKIK